MQHAGTHPGSQDRDRDCDNRSFGGSGRENLMLDKGWQDWDRHDYQGREGGLRTEVTLRGDLRGGYGGRGVHARLDRNRDEGFRDSSSGFPKGEQKKKSWGDIGPNTGVLRTED